MTVKYVQLATPFWYSSDNIGNPNAGGKIYFYVYGTGELATIYSTIAGPLGASWPNPVIIDDSGTTGPFYFADDKAYNIVEKDVDGNTLRSINGFQTQGSGGSIPVTVIQDVYNYLGNSSFYHNFPVPSPVPSAPTVIANGGWFFEKDGSSTNDSVTFGPFSVGGQPAVDTPAGNPLREFIYTAPGAPSGETYKYLYFRFDDVKSFANQQITFSIQQAVTGASGAAGRLFYWQYFGTGGSSDNIQVSSPDFIFDDTQYSQVIWSPTVDTTATKTAGAGNFFAIGVQFPLNTAGTFFIVEPQLETGLNAMPTYIYESIQDSDYRSVRYADYFQTGDVKLSYAHPANMPGWLLMDDGTLGKSTADHSGSQFFRLYSFLWNNVTVGQAPFFPPAARGVSAAADWAAGKNLTLPLTAGRVFGNVGQQFPTGPGVNTTWINGQTGGNQNHFMLATESAMPIHNHTAITNFNFPGGPGNYIPNRNIASNLGGHFALLNNGGMTGDIANTTLSTTINNNSVTTAANPMSMLQASTFANCFIHL